MLISYHCKFIITKWGHFYCSQGQVNNFPTEAQMGETANSGAAVAQSALARKQGSKNKTESTAAPAAMVVAPQPLQIPNGTDGKTYRKYQ